MAESRAGIISIKTENLTKFHFNITVFALVKILISLECIVDDAIKQWITNRRQATSRTQLLDNAQNIGPRLCKIGP